MESLRNESAKAISHENQWKEKTKQNGFKPTHKLVTISTYQGLVRNLKLL